jgi:ketosteroid isomerase-like protein
MRLCVLLFWVCLLGNAGHIVSAEPANPSHGSGDERTLWDLERAYWRYVENNDLEAYSDLWHKDFLGWPAVSAAPVRKDHITDWITSQTSKGLVFKTVEFKPAEMQLSGDVAFACYWVTFKWVDKDGAGERHIFRVTHAWLRSGKDWRIIGGMSMPEPESPAK